jgi:hypothetical protein
MMTKNLDHCDGDQNRVVIFQGLNFFFLNFTFKVKYCVTKKRGSENSQLKDRLHDPQGARTPDLFQQLRPMIWSSTPSESILPGVQHEITSIQIPYSHRPTEPISQHPSPSFHVHKNNNPKSFPVTYYIHRPNAQALLL